MGPTTSLADIYQGKMFPRNPTAHKVIQICNTPDAPLDPHAFYQTSFYPISPKLNYFVRIWIRRESPDNIPSGKFYLGASFQNYLQENINYTEGNGAYYHLFAKEGSQINGNWELITFTIGEKQTVKIIPDARFMAVCFYINYGNTTATYQACGATIRQI